MQIRILRGLIGRKQLSPHTAPNLWYCAFPSFRAPPPVVTYLSSGYIPRSRQLPGGFKFGLHIRNQRCRIGRNPVRRYTERRIVDPSPRPFSSPDSGSARHCPSWFYHLFPNFWKRRFQTRFRAIHSSSTFGESFYSSHFGWAHFPSHFGPPQIQPHIFNFGDPSLGDQLPLFKSNLRLCVLYLVNS